MSKFDLNLTACVSNADLQLTVLERQLIQNFRAMKSSTRESLVAMAAEMARTMPATPVQLTLVR